MKARIHWNVHKHMWTVHTYKGCEWGRLILLRGLWETETKPENRSNPRGFVVCYRDQVQILPIEKYDPLLHTGTQLIYDKKSVLFNFHWGRGMYFTPTGAYAIANH